MFGNGLEREQAFKEISSSVNSIKTIARSIEIVVQKAPTRILNVRLSTKTFGQGKLPLLI